MITVVRNMSDYPYMGSRRPLLNGIALLELYSFSFEPDSHVCLLRMVSVLNVSNFLSVPSPFVVRKSCRSIYVLVDSTSCDLNKISHSIILFYLSMLE